MGARPAAEAYGLAAIIAGAVALWSGLGLAVAASCACVLSVALTVQAVRREDRARAAPDDVERIAVWLDRRALSRGSTQGDALAAAAQALRDGSLVEEFVK